MLCSVQYWYFSLTAFHGLHRFANDFALAVGRLPQDKPNDSPLIVLALCEDVA